MFSKWDFFRKKYVQSKLALFHNINSLHNKYIMYIMDSYIPNVMQNSIAHSLKLKNPNTQVTQQITNHKLNLKTFTTCTESYTA